MGTDIDKAMDTDTERDTVMDINADNDTDTARDVDISILPKTHFRDWNVGNQ
jgi:hypothetical protein